MAYGSQLVWMICQRVFKFVNIVFQFWVAWPMARNLFECVVRGFSNFALPCQFGLCGLWLATCVDELLVNLQILCSHSDKLID